MSKGCEGGEDFKTCVHIAGVACVLKPRGGESQRVREREKKDEENVYKYMCLCIYD